uniref:Uncharacterized protein LOC117367657 n=1 Tax=Geotrypetes seraphini TaxID=260995 RepID=A0A6P8SIS3_GEOSA|nr:uncharacterized protein LOC117367657 [Geotrypetes seraphini]XP_033816329.1 uncharacterized protein LOC117367657 [Geotrypetes seraphini]
MSQILLQVRRTNLSGRRCVPPPLVPASPLCVSSDWKGSSKGHRRQCIPDPHHTVLAASSLVPRPPQPGFSGSLDSPTVPGSSHTTRRPVATSQSSVSQIDSLATAPTLTGDSAFPPEVLHILLASRAPATQRSYAAKWARFQRWCSTRLVHPSTSPLAQVLRYLTSLQVCGLSYNSIRLHLVAISVYHDPVDAVSLVRHPVVKCFFKGLLRLHPPLRPPVPVWDLNLVLQALMAPPFEPLSVVPLKFLTWKTLFLVAITSARQIGELNALVSYSPYTQFLHDKVLLRTHPKFLPKVVSAFHLNQSIVLPTFHPPPHTSPEAERLHTLDCARALRLYLDRTVTRRRPSQLFLSIRPTSSPRPVSKLTLSSWITQLIAYCYASASGPALQEIPPHVTAHDLRAMATTWANLRLAPLHEICRAATWSRIHTFAKHYCLDVESSADASLGSTVLQAAL